VKGYALADWSAYRWVACSKEMGEGIAAHRHLAVPGQLTTVCGATASLADIWRTNTTKLNCPLCQGSEKGKQIIAWQVENALGKKAQDPSTTRADGIEQRLAKVVKKSEEIDELLNEVASLMKADFPSVADYEAPAIEELRIVLKLTFRQPIKKWLDRWQGYAEARKIH
jgi:hypothetical protein